MDKDDRYFHSFEHAVDDGQAQAGPPVGQFDLVLELSEAVLGCTKRVPSGEAVCIPAGSEDGDRVPAGKTGWAWLQVSPHPLITRRGSDLVSRAVMDLSTAVFGGQVMVPSLENHQVITTVGPGVASGTQIRLPGLGVPHPSGRGDLVAVLELEVPSRLNRRQKKILKEFERSRHEAA